MAWSASDGLSETSDERFFVGSLSKIATFWLLEQIAGEHDIGPDSLAVDFVDPGLRPALVDWGSPSLVELVNHQTAVPEYLSPQYWAAVEAEPDRTWRVVDVLGFAPREGGPCGLYSNTNYMILQAVIESIEGQSLAEVWVDRSTCHADFEAGSFDWRVAEMVSGGMENHRGRSIRSRPTRAVVTSAGGAGGMVATASVIASLVQGVARVADDSWALGDRYAGLEQSARDDNVWYLTGRTFGHVAIVAVDRATVQGYAVLARDTVVDVQRILEQRYPAEIGATGNAGTGVCEVVPI